MILKSKNWLQRAISKVDMKKEERKLNLDDATNVALKRFNSSLIHRMICLKMSTRERKQNMLRWYRYQLQGANFVGNFALNGQMDKDIFIWARSNNVKQLVRHRLLPNGAEQGEYMFFLVFPVSADYPYTLIEKMNDLPYDPTNPLKSVGEKTYKNLLSKKSCFWDV